MNKSLFFSIFFMLIGIVGLSLFSSTCKAYTLPAHFGTSVGLKLAKLLPPEEFELKHIFKGAWEVDLMISSMTFLDGSLQFLTHANFGEENSGGGSLFYKLSENLYIGGTSSLGKGLDLDHALTALFSVKFNDLYVEPFVAFYLQSKKTAGGGVRFWWPKRASVSFGLERSEFHNHIFIMANVPIKQNATDFLSFFKGSEKE